jgi:hypothetical protein
MDTRKGRPPIEPVPQTEGERIEALASFGLDDEEIAAGLGIDVDTLRADYMEHLVAGPARARCAVLSMIHAKAMAGSIQAARLYLKATGVEAVVNKAPRKAPWTIRRTREAERARNACEEFPEWSFLKKSVQSK